MSIGVSLTLPTIKELLEDPAQPEQPLPRLKLNNELLPRLIALPHDLDTLHDASRNLGGHVGDHANRLGRRGDMLSLTPRMVERLVDSFRDGLTFSLDQDFSDAGSEYWRVPMRSYEDLDDPHGYNSPTSPG